MRSTPSAPDGATFQAFDRLREQGKVRFSASATNLEAVMRHAVDSGRLNAGRL
jgi:hypothetical protein